jgi:hypothetical protein
VKERLTREGTDLETDLVDWMEKGFRKYIQAAAHKVNGDCRWSHRMAQVAIGLDVMARGTPWVKSTFESFTGALFGMLDAARSMTDLEQIEYLMQDSVYLDLLAEIAEFETKNGQVSVSLQKYYNNKFSSLNVA